MVNVNVSKMIKNFQTKIDELGGENDEGKKSPTVGRKNVKNIFNDVILKAIEEDENTEE